ncbi:MAG: hypothetical protein ACKOPS_13635 [Cyanobium sp.]
MGRLFRVEYYSPRVREEIEAWPVDLLACCDELLDLLEDHGPQLGSPHSKAMGGGLFCSSSGPGAAPALLGPFTASAAAG